VKRKKSDNKKNEVVHYLDLGKFANASDSERREMVRDMLIALKRDGKKDPDVEG